MEKLSENVAAFLCVSQQQFPEISLCNHGDLCKLLHIQSDQLSNRLIHFLQLCHRSSSIRKSKQRLPLLGSHSGASGLWTLIIRASFHRIHCIFIFKNIFRIRRCFRFCILASEHGCLPDSSACLPVQRKCNPIKDRGFSCSRISGHQKKSLSSKLCKIDHSLIRIWTKCR